jgi:hypothetical protein
MTIFTRHKTPTRTVIQRHLTPAQLAWMKQNVEYECIGPPRPEVKFTRCGTLHGDGAFEPCRPSRRSSFALTACRSWLLPSSRCRNCDSLALPLRSPSSGLRRWRGSTSTRSIPRSAGPDWDTRRRRGHLARRWYVRAHGARAARLPVKDRSQAATGRQEHRGRCPDPHSHRFL